MMALPDGLYDLLLTEGLAARLEPEHAETQALTDNACDPLVEALARQLTGILEDISGDSPAKSLQQLALVNGLLISLRQKLGTEGTLTNPTEIIDLVSHPLRLLKAVQRNRQFPTPPETGLVVPWLFTAGKGSPSLLQEIRRELASADQVDILVSFITVSGVRKLQDVLQQISTHPEVCRELEEVAGVLQTRSSLPFNPVPGLEDTPLCLHAAYGAREILTAVGWLTSNRRTPFQAGVLPLTNRKTELLFVTLDKSEGYHDRIAYHDYAISAERFHWQTQNSAGPDTNSGRRYLESPSNGWQFQLFVRVRKSDAYRACGRVQLEQAEGDRPMSLVWRLESSLPIRLFREFSVLRGV